MWDKPVPVQQLVLAPAERADVLVDFGKFPGARLVMKNHKPKKPCRRLPPHWSRSCRFGSEQRLASPAPARSRPACQGGKPTCLTESGRATPP